MNVPERRLFRSRKEKVIAGVCGGIAEYFGIDPVIPRLLWVFLALGYGFGILAYLVCWIVIPQRPDEGAPPGAGPA